MRIAVLGVPADLGGRRRGTDMGPSALRYARVRERLAELGHQVTDLGNLHVPVPETLEVGDPRKRYFDAIAGLWRELADRTEAIARSGALPLVLGGDHSLSVGTVAGVRRVYEDLGVMWIDAHGDMNDPETSPSGNVHGMPLACITGDTTPDMLAALPEGLPIAPQRAALVGVRDLDPLEREKIRRSPMAAFTMKDIDEQGIGPVIRRAWEIASDGGRGWVHVSFDLDVVDPSIAGGVGTPVPGGLTFREAHLAMELLCELGRVVSVEVSEVNPILDTRNQTADLAVGLLSSLFGKRIL